MLALGSSNRHPELVSGSIVPLAQWIVFVANLAVGLFTAPSAQFAKWTLKQVQGDETFVAGASA